MNDSVRPLGGSRFAMPSRSGRGEYEVDLAAGTCSCPDFARRGLKCKYILAAEMFLTGRGHRHC